MCLQRNFKAPSFTRCSLSEGARPLCWSGAFGEIKNPLNQLCLSNWRCPRLPCLDVAHCHWPAHKTTCFLPRAQCCSDRVRVFIRYIEFLSVWKKLHQGINIGKENLRQRPGCEDSLRLGSHPSWHTGKESHLHTLSLAQWAVIGIHKRLKASYYSCGSVIYAAAIMALHHIADAFFFFLKERIQNRKKQIKVIKSWTRTGSYRECFWDHHWHFFEVCLFEILDGCLRVLLCGSPMGGVRSVQPLRPHERQVLTCYFSLSFCSPVFGPDILSGHLQSPRHYVSHFVCAGKHESSLSAILYSQIG